MMAWLPQLAWLLYVGVVAIWAAIIGYNKNGVVGGLVSFVIGIFVGAASATIWSFIFYFIFKIGRAIFLWSKRSHEK